MNRKNVIENVLYIIGVLVVLVGISYALMQRDKLQETLNEKENVISEMNIMIDRQQDQLEAYQSEVESLNIQFAELATSYEKLEANQVELSGKITKLEEEKAKLLDQVKTSNDKVKALQTDNANLKKKISSIPVAAPSRGGTKTASASKSAGKTINVVATAYTAYCNGCSGVTATGINLRNNPGLKVIAVDPKVIPLGTKVYVEGYGYAVAGDTGGAIKGNKIDLFMSSKSSALKFGRKTIQVKVLN